MGVKFNRHYPDIVHDMAKAVSAIPDCYAFFDMTSAEWDELDSDEQQAVVQTAADDIFYGLGNDPVVTVGSGKIEYDAANHIIKICSVPQVVHIVHLI